jgi:hypothetical protein
MPVVSTRTFARWVGRLDRDGFARFVAALYAAGPADAEVRADGAVAVRRRGGGETLVLVPVASGPHLRVPRVPSDADALVLAAPTRRLERVAAERGLDVVTPDDLRNHALYGLDRPDCERLFDRYFDASPTVRAAEDAASGRLDAVRARVEAAPLGSVAVVVVAALVVTAVLGPFGPGVGPDSDEANVTAGGQVVVGGSVESAEGRTDGLFPPGVGPTGVTDVETLAEAHADAVAGRSYRLVTRQTGTQDWTGRVWHGAWQQVEVEAPTTYRYDVVGYIVAGSAGEELVQYSVYADGTYNYVKTSDRGTDSFVRFPVRTDADGHGPFENRAADAIETYLNATRTTVSRSNWSLEPYKVVATGTPLGLSERGTQNVTDYRATAYVGPDGYVSLLTATYDVSRGNGTQTVSYRMEYAAMDDIDVDSPTWYETARNRTTPDRGPDATPSEVNDSTGEASTGTNETAPASENGSTPTETATNESSTEPNGSATEESAPDANGSPTGDERTPQAGTEPAADESSTETVVPRAAWARPRPP